MQLLINRLQIFFQKQKRLAFDNPEPLTDDEYQTFTSLAKIQLNDFISQISISHMSNSSNRSIRTAIAFLLCKLRLGLSNRLLAISFQTADKKIISRALESARTALLNRFVIYHLGLSHITRRQIIDQHTSTISRQLMCGDEFDNVIIVADETYIILK